MKVCRRCKIEKPLESFYKCRGMKDGHFNICKECQIPEGQKYRRLKSLDPEWVIKMRERSKRLKIKYGNPRTYKFPETQSGHIWRKYRNKINVIPRYQFHHWNYNLRYSVFYIHASLHSKLHTLVRLNETEKIYYFMNNPLNTKAKHREILDWINVHFEYNYQIIEYELDLL